MSCCCTVFANEDCSLQAHFLPYTASPHSILIPLPILWAKSKNPAVCLRRVHASCRLHHLLQQTVMSVTHCTHTLISPVSHSADASPFTRRVPWQHWALEYQWDGRRLILFTQNLTCQISAHFVAFHCLTSLSRLHSPFCLPLYCYIIHWKDYGSSYLLFLWTM